MWRARDGGPVAELEAFPGAQHPICNRENVGSSPTRFTITLDSMRGTFGCLAFFRRIALAIRRWPTCAIFRLGKQAKFV